MKSTERFKVLNKIRNNTNLIMKCQICGATQDVAKIETMPTGLPP